MEHVTEPGIAPGRMEDRRYQAAMAAGCLRENTLVILPTGLGKTAVAARVAARVLSEGGKVLALAPTKPLVDQHAAYFSEMLPECRVEMINGLMAPEKRKRIVSECDFVISTPQSVSNDLDNRMYGLEPFGLVIFDEAHRATGSYAYVNVAAHIPSGVRSSWWYFSLKTSVRRCAGGSAKEDAWITEHLRYRRPMPNGRASGGSIRCWC